MIRVHLADPGAAFVSGTCLGRPSSAPTESDGTTRRLRLIERRGPSPALLIAKPRGGTAHAWTEVVARPRAPRAMELVRLAWRIAGEEDA